jgi:nucleotide-binding universal stress UspA family protein
MRAKQLARLEELLASTRHDLQKCSLHVLDGDARLEVPRHVARESIDLLVLGTVARTGIAGLLIGNTTEEILRRVDCSVLALKPDGFESPVKLP